MAKVGEGDPRWLVSERTDGRNVNNWHWEERNVLGWVSDRVREKLHQATLLGTADAGEHLVVASIEKLDGEATLCARKGKLMLFYDLDVRFKVKGKYGGDEAVNVELRLPEVSDDQVLSDLEMKVVTVEGVGDANRDGLRRRLLGEVRERVRNLLEPLAGDIDAYKQSFIQTNGAPRTILDTETIAPSVSVTSTPASTPNNSTPGLVSPGGLETYSERVVFKCSPMELYLCFVQQERVQAFSRCVAELQAKVGGTFRLYDGLITGEFLELVPGSRLAMHWRLSSWPASARPSLVTLTIEDSKQGAIVSLVQKDLPPNTMESIGEGWDRFYWTPIRQAFGFILS